MTKSKYSVSGVSIRGRFCSLFMSLPTFAVRSTAQERPSRAKIRIFSITLPSVGDYLNYVLLARRRVGTTVSPNFGIERFPLTDTSIRFPLTLSILESIFIDYCWLESLYGLCACMLINIS